MVGGKLLSEVGENERVATAIRVNFTDGLRAGLKLGHLPIASLAPPLSVSLYVEESPPSERKNRGKTSGSRKY